MPDIPRHLLVGIDYGGGETPFIAEVDPTSVRVSPAIAAEIQKAGALHPQIKLMLTAEPVIEFATWNIKLLTGPALLSEAAPLKLYFRALSDTIGYGTGWISLAAINGMVVPTTMAGSKGKAATLGVTAHLTSSDGDTAPIQVGTASPTAVAPANFYCLGTVTITSALTGVTEASLAFGYKVAKNTGENGHAYPTLCYVTDQDGKLTAGLEGLAAASQARTMIGTAETTVTVSWRKLSQAAIPVDAGGYMVTAQKAAVHIEQISGNRPAALQLVGDLLATAFDGTDYLQFADVSE